MRTAIYAADFLGPLGAAFDRRVVAAWTRVWFVSEETTVYRDPDEAQPAFARLVGDIRERRCDRLLLRWVADLCLTTGEVFDLVRVLGEARVKVEVACDVTPADLFADRPERLAEFRRRVAVAKVLRLHRAGLGVGAVAKAAGVSRGWVARELTSRSLCNQPGEGT